MHEPDGDPRNGAPIRIAAKNVVKFRPGTELSVKLRTNSPSAPRIRTLNKTVGASPVSAVIAVPDRKQGRLCADASAARRTVTPRTAPTPRWYSYTPDW